MKNIVQLKSDLQKKNFDNLRVFLRADLNVPRFESVITDDFRLQAIAPTIDLLLQKGAKIILATHIGRPKEHERSLSTQILLPWFKQHGYDVVFAPTLEDALQKSTEDNNKIVLLENLRFFKGEKTNDPEFDHALEQLADVYVNDAFGVMHRTDASVVALPRLFPPDRCAIGLLVEQELASLNELKNDTKKPFVIIIGGAKIETKLPLIRSMIGVADTILLCPAIAFTFLKALGKSTGTSLVAEHLIPTAKEILRTAQQNGTEIIFPVDYQVAEQTFDGPVSISDSTEIPDDYMGMSIGPKTEKLFTEKIADAKKVFFNGAIGNPKKLETLKGMETLLKAMGKADAFSVVAGGDSVAMTLLLGLNLQMDRCLTGGGAALAYLAGQELPGLKPFINEEN